MHWFRHGLRLHDNPALLKSLEGAKEFYALFIWDGEVAGKIWDQSCIVVAQSESNVMQDILQMSGLALQVIAPSIGL